MNMLNIFDFSIILDTLPNPIFMKDENSRFVFVNKAYEKMFNVKRQDVLGKRVLDLEYLPEADRIFYQEEDMEMIALGKTRHHIFDYLYQGREKHTCLYWTNGFVQPNGVRGLIGVIVDVNRQSKRISSLRKQLHTVSSEKRRAVKEKEIDALTQLHNRGAFNETLEKLTSSGQEGFSCIMLDIDHFKLVNDTFGHAAGDAVLKGAASVLQKFSRKHDMVFRYGGEEFVVLLPGSRVGEAVMAAERMREGVAANVRLPDGRNVTISAGCSEHIAGEGGSLAVLRADEALYTAKQSGRNRVCAF